jgi:hypothetical protein
MNKNLLDTRVVSYPSPTTTKVVIGDQPSLVFVETVVGPAHHLTLLEGEECLGTLLVQEWEAPTLYSFALSAEETRIALVAYGLKGLIKLPL